MDNVYTNIYGQTYEGLHMSFRKQWKLILKTYIDMELCWGEEDIMV